MGRTVESLPDPQDRSAFVLQPLFSAPMGLLAEDNIDGCESISLFDLISRDIAAHHGTASVRLTCASGVE